MSGRGVFFTLRALRSLCFSCTGCCVENRLGLATKPALCACEGSAWSRAECVGILRRGLPQIACTFRIALLVVEMRALCALLCVLQFGLLPSALIQCMHAIPCRLLTMFQVVLCPHHVVVSVALVTRGVGHPHALPLLWLLMLTTNRSLQQCSRHISSTHTSASLQLGVVPASGSVQQASSPALVQCPAMFHRQGLSAGFASPRKLLEQCQPEEAA
jgi:hypothetical protein